MHAMVTCKELEMDGYAEVRAAWQGVPGLGLSSADEPEAMAAFLARNPGGSFVARDADGRIVGTALSGNDGRRAFVYHLWVDGAYRGRGVGKTLVEHCRTVQARQGIAKMHVMVFADNQGGRAFWSAAGFVHRDDIALMSCSLEGDPDKAGTCPGSCTC